MSFKTVSVTYEGGTLHVNGKFTDESQSDELFDLVLAAMRDTFELGEEIEYEDPILGSLYYIYDSDGFEGLIQLGGKDDVKIVFLSSPGVPPQASLARAHDIVKRWEAWTTLIAKCILEELFELYTKEWSSMDEDATEHPLSSDAFLQRMSVYSLIINQDLNAQLYFDADGMFTEHGVTVSISADDEIEAWMQ